jgi:protocatechuate 3,4-dioxygenase beta subunit
MKPYLLVAFATLLVTASATAQDADYIRALERTQQARPAVLTSSARIAPEGEPGAPLVIHGRAFAADRKTPLADAVIFAYHTDREGLYDRPGTAAHSWRLRGWAKTGADGRFEFRTIRPGAYPRTSIEQHVHFTIFTAGGERYHATSLNFEDDKFVSEADRATSARQGEFGGVRPIRREGDVQHVDFRVAVEAGSKF